MKEREILEVLADLRGRYPCFHDRLRWPDLKSVLEDHHIIVRQRPLRRERARLVVMGGVGVMSIRAGLPARYWTRDAAHEFAHYLLHGSRDEEVVYQLRTCTPDDTRELEASYLAEWMVLGPYADPAPQLQRSASRTPARRARNAPPPTYDPYVAPLSIAPIRREPRYGGRAGETALQHALRVVRPAPRPMRAGPQDDVNTVLYERGGIVRYVDDEGRRWRIYDIAYRPGREVVPLGSLAAKCRVFVNAIGVQRRYVFTRWELRDVAARHFERQLRDASVVAPRTVSQRHGAAG